MLTRPLPSDRAVLKGVNRASLRARMCGRARLARAWPRIRAPGGATNILFKLRLALPPIYWLLDDLFALDDDAGERLMSTA